MTNNANVEAFTYKDVRGKEQMYLRITANNKEHLISIGLKTKEKIDQLLGVNVTTKQKT